MKITPEPLPAHVEDLSGRRFGRWIVLKYAGCRNRFIRPSPGRSLALGGVQKIRTWQCRCDCGVTRNVPHHNLTKGCSTQCADCGHEGRYGRHGGSRTPEYDAWRKMRKGGDYCDEWKDFPAFLAALGPKTKGQGLHRHDERKFHAPGNSYWWNGRTNTEEEKRETVRLDVELTLGMMMRADPGLDEDATRKLLLSVTKSRRGQLRNQAMGKLKRDERDHPKPVTGPLLEAINAAVGKSLLSIERETGVSMSAVQRFAAGDGIRSDSLDRLATHFGMILVKESETQTKGKSK